MAKYIVERTSERYGKPIEEAVKCEVHEYFSLSGRAAESFRKSVRELVDVEWEEKDGSFGGFMKSAQEVWVCDIPDLHAFVEKYGKIILMKPSVKEGYWTVEIYDDYRE